MGGAILDFTVALGLVIQKHNFAKKTHPGPVCLH